MYTAIDCHSLWIYILILLSLLSFSIEMTVSPLARQDDVAEGAGEMQFSYSDSPYSGECFRNAGMDWLIWPRAMLPFRHPSLHFIRDCPYRI